MVGGDGGRGGCGSYGLKAARYLQILSVKTGALWTMFSSTAWNDKLKKGI